MNKGWLNCSRTVLATAIGAVVLAGCGGDSSSEGSNDASTFMVTALDGYLHKASVSIDNDENGVCETVLSQTNEQGQLAVDSKYKGKPICVEAVAGTTVDMTRGLVDQDFTLRAPSGAEVVNPLTNLVVEQLESDDSLSLEDAQTAVVKALTDSGMQVDKDDAFGDYLSQTNSADDALKSKQLEIIGEVLVDNHNKQNISPTVKLSIVKQVAEKVEGKTSADELENFSPVVGDIDANGNFETIKENHRPISTGAVDLRMSAETSDGGTTSLSLINDYGMQFADNDTGDTITYKVSTTSEYQNGVSINDQGVLSGIKHDKAGSYTFYIFAIDSHGAKSKPIELIVTFTSTNLPPTVDSATKATFEQTILALDFTQGVPFPTQTISLAGLFVDEDVASLNIFADTDALGLTASIVDGQLVMSGTPTAEGEWNLVVWAEDGVNQEQASVNIFYTVKPSDTSVAHPLEDQVYYFVNNESGGEHPILNCQSVKFENSNIYFSMPAAVDEYTCREPVLQVGTYTVNGATLETAITVGQVTEKDSINIVEEFTLNQGALVKATSLTNQTNGVADIWLAELFKSSKHVESTLNIENSGTVYRTLLWFNERYIDPNVSVTFNGHSKLNSQPKVRVSFDSSLNCGDLGNIYSTFYLANENGYSALSNNCVVDNNTNQPSIIFDDLSAMGEVNLIDGKAYTITSDLTPAYTDKMAPLAMRVLYSATKECLLGNDAEDQSGTPSSLTTPLQYQQAVSDCKTESATITNIESVITTLVNPLPSKSFKLKGEKDTYVFYQLSNGERSMYVTEHNSDGQNTSSETVAIAKWNFQNGMISIFDATDPNNSGAAMNVRETIELTSWNYDEMSIAVKKLFQSDEYDHLGYGAWETHGLMSSDVYVLETASPASNN